MTTTIKPLRAAQAAANDPVTLIGFAVVTSLAGVFVLVDALTGNWWPHGLEMVLVWLVAAGVFVAVFASGRHVANAIAEQMERGKSA